MILNAGSTDAMNVIRGFFSSIDSFIYKFLGTMYDMTIDISNIIYFGSNDNAVVNVGDFTRKIYLLLGVFMVFKVSFSFIKYMVNPDDFTDKGKGVQKIVQNIVIVLALLIAVPWIFDKLYDLQDAIISDKVIERLIFEESDSGQAVVGTASNAFVMSDVCRFDKNHCPDPNDCVFKSQAATSGDYIALTLFKPFYQYNQALINGEDTVIPAGYCTTAQDLTIESYLSADHLTESTDDSIIPFFGDNGLYYIDYRFFLSTVVGIVALLYMLSIAFDIVVRCLQLGFLQMIAPIPIISYIDPDSGKQGMFKKWYQEVGKVWATLFIRLFVLYFAVFIISKITFISDKTPALAGKSSGYMLWLNIIFVLGALMFAKKFPSWIEELIPGLKLGKLQLNPFSKIKSEALGGEAIAKLPGRAAVGLGAAGLATAGFIARNKMQKKDALEKAEKSANKDIRKQIADLNARQRRNYQDVLMNKISASEYLKRKQQNEQNMNNVKSAAYRDSLIKQKTKEELDKKFSSRHPGMAGAAGVGRALVGGVQKGAKNPADALKNIREAATEAAKMANYNDTEGRTPKGRVADFVTDIAGKQNESGGTGALEGSIKKLDKQIKSLQETLQDQGRYINDRVVAMANQNPNLGSLFQTSFTRGVDGYTYDKTNVELIDTFKELIPVIEQFNANTTAMNDAKKEMRSQQKMVDAVKKK